MGVRGQLGGKGTGANARQWPGRKGKGTGGANVQGGQAGKGQYRIGQKG
jgi:hypothetical protein